MNIDIDIYTDVCVYYYTHKHKKNLCMRLCMHMNKIYKIARKIRLYNFEIFIMDKTGVKGNSSFNITLYVYMYICHY